MGPLCGRRICIIDKNYKYQAGESVSHQKVKQNKVRLIIVELCAKMNCVCGKSSSW